MAKSIKSKLPKKTKREEVLPFERENYIIFGVGLLFILAGYVALSGNSVEGFVPLTLAPLLLVIGYCVIIPIAIMYRKRSNDKKSAQPMTAEVSQPAE
jgi:hypothetical protein